MHKLRYIVSYQFHAFFPTLGQKQAPLKGPSEKTVYELDKNSLSDQDFREWLRGFIDAEGCFIINPPTLWVGQKASEFSFGFVFRIKLHRDDRSLLCYIRDRLNIGNIHPLDQTENKIWVSWTVSNKEDVEKLISILAPLNTSKNLDFQNFKKAFNLVKQALASRGASKKGLTRSP